MAEWSKRAFSNSRIQRKLSPWGRNAHSRKQFLRKLPSGFSPGILPLSLPSSMTSQVSLHGRHDNSVSKLSLRKKCLPLLGEATVTKQFLRQVLRGFFLKMFPFHRRPLCAAKYPFVTSTKSVFPNCRIQIKFSFCEMSERAPKHFLRKLFSSVHCKKFPFSL